MPEITISSELLSNIIIAIVSSAISLVIGYTISKRGSQKIVGDVMDSIEDLNFEAIEKKRHYVIRTILFQLKAIYGGGDSRMAPTSENRNEWFNNLCHYRKKDTEGVLTKLYNLIEQHPFEPIKNYEDNKPVDQLDEYVRDLPQHKKIVDEINKLLKHPFPHPIMSPYGKTPCKKS